MGSTFWSSGETTSFGLFSRRSIFWKLLLKTTTYPKVYKVNKNQEKRRHSFFFVCRGACLITWVSVWRSTADPACVEGKFFVLPIEKTKVSTIPLVSSVFFFLIGVRMTSVGSIIALTSSISSTYIYSTDTQHDCALCNLLKFLKSSKKPFAVHFLTA